MNDEKFTYWKRPWHKWLTLAVAVLQLLSLCLNLEEYRQIISAGFLSASVLDDYTTQRCSQLVTSGLLAATFFGEFLVGSIVRSQKARLLGESLLLLAIGAMWGLASAALHLFSLRATGLFCWLILLLALGGAAYNFWRYRKSSTQ